MICKFHIVHISIDIDRNKYIFPSATLAEGFHLKIKKLLNW